VATQKAGTTWWNQAITSHPQIHGHRKEVHFFDDNWDQEITDVQVAEYHQYFPRPEGGLSGEWTPRYMLDPWTPQRLRRCASDARLLVLLRDPIARLRSGLSHTDFHSGGRLRPRLLNESIDYGRYGEQLERLARHFPLEQILVLQFERCVQDPERELARTFAFIGVDAGFVPQDLHDPVNQQRATGPPIPPDIFASAREIYVADRERLPDWAEIDLELWPEVRP
jgi:hypothetical protein